MKKLKISFFLIFVVAFFATSQANAQVVHDEWIFDVECDPTAWCMPEPITGYIIYNVIYRYDKEGNNTGVHFNTKYGRLTGCETGMVYKVKDVSNEIYNVNKNNDQEVWNLSSKLVYVGKKGVKYFMTWKGHFSMDANGEIKVDYFEFTSDCE